MPETTVVTVPDNNFAAAYQWACTQLIKKYPGAEEQIQTLDALVKQHLTANNV